MNRREWLMGSAALAAAAGVSSRMAEAAQAAAAAKPAGREYYLLRRYTVSQGVQAKGTNAYFQGALLPALGRMGMGPVGVFTLSYGEDTPLKLIERVKPTVLVKGGDYTRATVVGHEIVEAHGGEIILVNLVPGHSTTSMVERSRKGR